MRVEKCELCETVLSSTSELASGLCTRHIELLGKDDVIVGVCWNCNSITHHQEIPEYLNDSFTEKYLFTRKCTHCNGTPKDNIAWITFEKFKEENKYIEDYITRIPQSRKADHDNQQIIYDI